MAKYKFIDVSYTEKDDRLKINDDIEHIIEEQSMYGFRLANIIDLEVGILGPIKIKLIFEKEK